MSFFRALNSRIDLVIPGLLDSKWACGQGVSINSRVKSKFFVRLPNSDKSEANESKLTGVYENFPCELLGANKDKLLDYLQCWINEWENTTMDTPVFMENIRYVRSTSVDEQTFDDDLLLMNQETKKVVVLNAASTVFWRLLDTPTSSEDLVCILNEALPNEALDNKKTSVNKLLIELLNAGLIQPMNH